MRPTTRPDLRSRLRSRPTLTVLMVLLLALAPVAATCSGDDADGDSATAEPDELPFEQDGGGEAASDDPTAEDGGNDASIGDVDLASVQPGRDLIVTASVDIEVADVTTAAREATRLVTASGGFLAEESTQLAGRATSTLVFRLPPDTVDTTLEALADLGDVTRQNVGTEDVTAVIVDLESRIRSLEISIDRLNGFLAEATTVTDIASLETELLDRETRLEQLRGQLRATEDLVELATLTVGLSTVERPPEIVDEEDDTGFAAGLDAGLDVLGAIGTAIAATAGFLVPLSVVVVPSGLVVLLLTRRFRRSPDPTGGGDHHDPTGPTPPPGPDQAVPSGS